MDARLSSNSACVMTPAPSASARSMSRSRRLRGTDMCEDAGPEACEDAAEKGVDGVVHAGVEGATEHAGVDKAEERNRLVSGSHSCVADVVECSASGLLRFSNEAPKAALLVLIRSQPRGSW